MIRCVRLWTGQDGASHVEIGRLDIQPGRNDDLVSAAMSSAHVTVEETRGRRHAGVAHRARPATGRDTRGHAAVHHP